MKSLQLPHFLVLFGKMAQPFIFCCGQNANFLVFVVDDSTRWKLDEYFKLAKERATVAVRSATASDSELQHLCSGLSGVATASVVIRNVKVHLLISRQMLHLDSKTVERNKKYL